MACIGVGGADAVDVSKLTSAKHPQILLARLTID